MNTHRDYVLRNISIELIGCLVTPLSNLNFFGRGGWNKITQY